MLEIKQTSRQWYKYYNRVEGLIIATYEGWNGDLKKSFETEKVTLDEFLDRLAKSNYSKNQ